MIACIYWIKWCSFILRCVEVFPWMVHLMWNCNCIDYLKMCILFRTWMFIIDLFISCCLLALVVSKYHYWYVICNMKYSMNKITFERIKHTWLFLVTCGRSMVRQRAFVLVVHTDVLDYMNVTTDLRFMEIINPVNCKYFILDLSSSQNLVQRYNYSLLHICLLRLP